jgi:hypothetical protein
VLCAFSFCGRVAFKEVCSHLLTCDPYHFGHSYCMILENCSEKVPCLYLELLCLVQVFINICEV